MEYRVNNFGQVRSKEVKYTWQPWCDVPKWPMKLNPHRLHNTSKHIGVNRRQDFDVGQNVFDDVALVLSEQNLFPKYQLAVQRMIFLKWQRRKQLSLEQIQKPHLKKSSAWSKMTKNGQTFLDFWTFSFPVEVTGTLSPYPIVVKVTKPHQSESANVSKWAGFSSCSTYNNFVLSFYSIVEVSIPDK